jgi:transcriptional regulator with XRE-family HTH domain
MAQIAAEQHPHEVLKHLAELGQRVRTARVRRRLSTEDLAQACGIGRRTLYRIENGEPGIALGTFLCVLWKLALLDTLGGVANPDTDDHGKILEAAARPQRVRALAADNDF